MNQPMRIARLQPMKLAAFEGLYEGQKNAGLVALGLLNPEQKVCDTQEPFTGFDLHIPGLLSLLANRSVWTFVPGINDLVYGNPEENIHGRRPDDRKRAKWRLPAWPRYKAAKKNGSQDAAAALADFNANKEYLGYGYLEKPEEAVPPVALTFYSLPHHGDPGHALSPGLPGLPVLYLQGHPGASSAGSWGWAPSCSSCR